MPTKTATDLRFVYEIKRNYPDRGTSTFTARVVYKTEPTEWNTSGIWNPLDSSEDFSEYYAFGITAYYHTSDQGWYGAKAHYLDATYIDLRQAERMVKVLRKIGKALDRFNQEFGYTDDVPTICARVAKAIGCKTADCFGHRENEITINGTPYRWVDVNGLRRELEKIN